MRVLNLRTFGAKSASRHPAIKGRQKLGNGCFSTVYDNGDTVLKMTVDKFSHASLTEYTGLLGTHFPFLINDYEVIGQQGDLDIYLMEIEKLVPVSKTIHKEAKRLARKLCKMYNDAYYSFTYNGIQNKQQRMSAALNKVSESSGLPESIVEALQDVENFICNYNATTDFHMGNFMVRESDGTLVFNDVVCDYDLIKVI